MAMNNNVNTKTPQQPRPRCYTCKLRYVEKAGQQCTTCIATQHQAAVNRAERRQKRFERETGGLV